MRIWLLAAATAALFASCGDYNKVLKSTDPAYKLERAIQYYDTKNFSKAYPLFDELMTSYRGTTKAQIVYRYFAKTLYAQHEYLLASYHFKRFAQGNLTGFVFYFTVFDDLPFPEGLNVSFVHVHDDFKVFIRTIFFLDHGSENFFQH